MYLEYKGGLSNLVNSGDTVACVTTFSLGVISILGGP